MIQKISSLLFLLFVPFYVYSDVPIEYYRAADGKQKRELKTAFHEIIKHANVLSYGSGKGATWDGFYSTDRFNGNQVRDRYCNEVRYFSGGAGSVPGGMNIEHSFPKSWWGGSKTQAYKDLHHLMPCEVSINSSKSNYPMGKVTEVKVDNGCTRVGRGPGANGAQIQLWEPADEWKGDFARVYFYMATCYQDYNWSGTSALNTLEKNDWPTLQPWAYTLFLQWCKDDPVDDIERERNEAVYQIQGNRNPFIDFPSLGEYIWGDSVNYVFYLDKSHGGGTVEPDPDPETPPTATDWLDVPFKSDLGGFQVVTSTGAPSDMWAINTRYACVMANAFNSGKQADDYLVSPRVDLTRAQDVSFTFEHATGFNGSQDVSQLFQVLVSTDYNGVPQDAHWTVLTPTYPSAGSSSFTSFVSSGEFDLSAYAGQKITIAFRYQANASACYAWEVRKLRLWGNITTGISLPQAERSQAKAGFYTLSGTYVGTCLPKRKGTYIRVEKGVTTKLTVR